MGTERRSIFVGDVDPSTRRFRVKPNDFWIDTRRGPSLKLAVFGEDGLRWNPADLSVVVDDDNYSRVSVGADGSISAYVVADGSVRSIVTLGRDGLTLTGPSGRQLMLGEHLVFAGDFPTSDPHQASVAYIEGGFVKVSAG